ncbi:MAG: HAD family hydrolase [Helicobacteraceae bacterium]|jgi:phosphoglycolate phosphatase|nr:HAD family hydrolase [Helicobacteraceae bacterium]
MKSIVIFDLDGTLVDSKDNIGSSINYVRARKGLSALSRADIIENVNALTFQSIKNFYGDDANAADHKVFKTHYEKACLNDLRLYDGIAALLKTLNDRRVKMGVATNATSAFARKMLDYAGVSRYFTAIVGADCVANPKPAPDMLNLTLQSIKGDTKEAVFLGDSVKDMKAADAAGITGVFAAWGYGKKGEFADRAIQKPLELLEVL